ncbi:MAG: methylmalonyl Co-A mutase-associated GTPase MeaB [Pseudomonadota bacterium]
MVAIRVQQLLGGDRRTLAKAITLVESQLPVHQQQAQRLLSQLLLHTGKSLRLGISGTPGVGKSTFIEAFGQYLLDQGLRIAVLAVDPSSPIAGGSILGDKTRMEQLSREPNAYIRPSPAAGALGGVAQTTRESLLLCEAAGFDVVLVETVGVGQSEYQVANMVDFFLLLMQPNTGDELQGIKKGILELADAIVVNKADGNLASFAERDCGQYQQVLGLVTRTGFWQPKVVTCSALENRGIDRIWSMVVEYRDQARTQGEFDRKRAQQNTNWMMHLFEQELLTKAMGRPGFTEQQQDLKNQVATGRITPLVAARALLELK